MPREGRVIWPQVRDWNNEMTRAQTVNAMEALHGFMQTASLDQINQHLGTSCGYVETVPLTLALTSLRLTALSRDSLPDWRKLRDELRAVVVARGLNAHEVLVGLIGRPDQTGWKNWSKEAPKVSCGRIRVRINSDSDDIVEAIWNPSFGNWFYGTREITINFGTTWAEVESKEPDNFSDDKEFMTWARPHFLGLERHILEGMKMDPHYPEEGWAAIVDIDRLEPGTDLHDELDYASDAYNYVAGWWAGWKGAKGR